jgi:hypothetical protein
LGSDGLFRKESVGRAGTGAIPFTERVHVIEATWHSATRAPKRRGEFTAADTGPPSWAWPSDRPKLGLVAVGSHCGGGTRTTPASVRVVRPARRRADGATRGRPGTFGGLSFATRLYTVA